MNKSFKLFIVLGMLLASSLGYSQTRCFGGFLVSSWPKSYYGDTAKIKPSITLGPGYYLAEYDFRLRFDTWFTGTCSMTINRKNNSAYFSNNGFRIDEKPVYRIYESHCTSYAALEPSVGVVDDDLNPSVTWFHNNSYGTCYAKFKVTFKLFAVSGETYDESKPIYTPQFTLVGDDLSPNQVKYLGDISGIQKPPDNCSVVLSSKIRK